MGLTRLCFSRILALRFTAHKLSVAQLVVVHLVVNAVFAVVEQVASKPMPLTASGEIPAFSTAARTTSQHFLQISSEDCSNKIPCWLPHLNRSRNTAFQIAVAIEHARSRAPSADVYANKIILV